MVSLANIAYFGSGSGSSDDGDDHGDVVLVELMEMGMMDWKHGVGGLWRNMAVIIRKMIGSTPGIR